MENIQQLFSLKGKVALIAGGSGGLGSAIAEGFLQSGAVVVAASRHPEKATDLQDLAEAYPHSFFGYPVNLVQQAPVEKMVEELEQKLGKIDILVNAAGINILKKAEDYDPESFDAVMDVNVKGTHLLTKAVGKGMITRQYGRIINLSSVKGQLGAAQDYLAYCTSKGAINMYTKQIACEWAKYNITCNAIAPTFVRTAINAAQLDDLTFYRTLLERIPLGRIGKKEDIAAAALYLASDAAAFVTGQILGVDGGLTARQ
ncbi:SDR family oxidoreductase [Ruminococcaceae bacterium OttesenSCG-928-A16]|nr:SDR family oxidoreductase [Ruminococcaceae bacterium OttesenSCG-928-A16]